MEPTLQAIHQGLDEIRMLDAHTHVDAGHLTARGLHDILLYHMHGSDLYSAGCPSGARMPEEPDEELIASRLEEAIPYLPYVENTSCNWGMHIILKDLYGWEKPVTLQNWRELHGIIGTKFKEKDWAREVLHRAGIQKVSTELWRGRDGIAGDILAYSIEWAFFTRAQWGQYDTALLELENAWNQETPGAPLPVTVDTAKLHFAKQIRTLEDVDEAIRYYCGKIPYAQVSAIASHFSTDIHYRSVTPEEMRTALEKRADAGVYERDVYANYIFEAFLKQYRAGGHQAILQFSVGAEPLPFETGSKLKTDTVYEIAAMISRYPEIQFQIFLSSMHQNQAFCTLARELPNLSLSGYWWHNFFPATIRRIMDERLDMLPSNKQVGFFSDAYCFDWAYAKAVLVKKQLAGVLSQRVEQGQYTVQTALRVAQEILCETPARLLHITKTFGGK